MNFQKCIAFVLTNAYNNIYDFFERMIFLAKTANLYARIEPEVKEQAESILSSLGIPVSNAINMFYKQIILQGGIPFALKLPKNPVPVLSEMNDSQLNEELEKGFSDFKNGKTTPANKVFADIRQDYNI